MKKTLIAGLMMIAGIAQSQTVETCGKEEFVSILYAQHLSTTQCLDAKDCQDYLDSIKKHCTADMVIQQDLSVGKAISNIQRKKDNFIASAKEAKRLAALPGARIGMTAEQVLKETSWGKPRSINRTTTAYGTREQWVYGNSNYLYFTNGVLTSIQN
jgi:hypothetical protein